MSSILGYQRQEGRPGIRNLIAVIYTVDCSRMVAEEIARGFAEARVFGFAGCHANETAYETLVSLGTHPNVGAVLVVALGCEGLDYRKLARDIERGGREARLLIIQESGTRRSIEKGHSILLQMTETLKNTPRCQLEVRDLIIGIECGGSDATSGLAANPAVGRMADKVVEQGGTVLVEELTEMLGCEHILSTHCVSESVQSLVTQKLAKAEHWSRRSGYFSISPGNREGGLTTIEEKSLGAVCKIGTSPIMGVIDRNELPPGRGLYLIDTTDSPDGKWLCLCWSFDAQCNTALSASHCHIIVFTTGRGNVIGAAVSPVIKVTGNPGTYSRMIDDMDINAGKIITGEASLEDMGLEIYDKVLAVAAGEKTKSERLGHFESGIAYHF